MKLTFIGGGNMARALIAGLKSQQFPMTDITVIELTSAKRMQLESDFGVATSENYHAIADANIVFLAIKPQQLAALAASITSKLKQQLVISIAAGVKTKSLSEWMGGYQRIVRCMPNTPAQIQEGITGLYATASVNSSQKNIAEQLLSAVGDTLWLSDEKMIDVVTAISGSGPAYVFYLIEALQTAALELGLDASQAKRLSIATFKGASLLADASAVPINELRKQVTSKGGTTEQGITTLENAKMKEIIHLTTKKAFERAQALGRKLDQQ